MGSSLALFIAALWHSGALVLAASDKTELLQHRHLVPLLPTFGYLISSHMIKDQSVELNLLSCWLCLSERAIVSSFRYPSEGGFVTGNHLIFHRYMEVRKRHQEASDQLFER